MNRHLWGAMVFWCGALLANAHPAGAWHDETHLAVAKAAGYAKWYNAAGPDVAKIKAEKREQQNHYYNNNRNADVTSRMVLEQVQRYNSADDDEGHLYGAIIAAVREFERSVRENKYAQYHLAYCAHYIADLSQPLHNTPYDEFNKNRHSANDGIVESKVLTGLFRVERRMYLIELRRERFEEDLAREIARIANLARNLGNKLRKENRDMTPEEAYTQLGHSASLLEAVLAYLGE